MYEYRILETKTPTATEDQLNRYAEQGWELVTIVGWEGEWFYYFKRAKVAA